MTETSLDSTKLSIKDVSTNPNHNDKEGWLQATGNVLISKYHQAEVALLHDTLS